MSLVGRQRDIQVYTSIHSHIRCLSSILRHTEMYKVTIRGATARVRVALRLQVAPLAQSPKILKLQVSNNAVEKTAD